MSIQPAQFNIPVQKRSEWSYFVELLDEADNIIDLTGATVYSQIWDKSRTTKFADFVIDYVDRLLGQFTWTLPAASTINLPPECFYDLLVVDSLERPYYLLEGLVFVSEGYSSP